MKRTGRILCVFVSAVLVMCVSNAATAGTVPVNAALSGNTDDMLSSGVAGVRAAYDTSALFDVTQGMITITGAVDTTNIDTAILEIGLVDKRVYDAVLNGTLPNTFNDSALAVFYVREGRMKVGLKDVSAETGALKNAAGPTIGFTYTIDMDHLDLYNPKTNASDKQWKKTGGVYIGSPGLPVGMQSIIIDNEATWKNYPWGAYSTGDSFWDGSLWQDPELTYNGAYLVVQLLGATAGNVTYDVRATGPGVVPEPLTMLGMFLGLGSVGAYIRKRTKTTAV